jgi:hypothetical protein
LPCYKTQLEKGFSSVGSLHLWEINKGQANNTCNGTVFAILFNRPFLSVKLGGSKVGLNSRMQHLLSELGLEERQVALSDGISAVRKMKASIDWVRVNKRIMQMRDDGVHFLTNELKYCIKSH